jgi:hypothetical protein
MRRSLTSADDVVGYLLKLEPDLAVLEPGTLQDIVRSCTRARYEAIGPDELDAMYQAAMLQLSVAHDEG